MFINKNKLTSKKTVLKSHSKYVFGHNGVEKTNEIAGIGNHYTAEFGEYDPRSVWRWNTDPKPDPSVSPYVMFSNNPIFNADILLDSPTVANQQAPTSAESQNQESEKPRTPGIMIRYGDAGGPFTSDGGNGPTTIWGLYGNKNYYNSNMWRSNGQFAPDEPDNFFQLQIRVGGKESNTQFNVSLFKQKFDQQNGFGYEAPTAIHIGLSKNYNLARIGNFLNLSSNVSIGAGVEAGKPRFDNSFGNVVIPARFNIAGYRAIGVGGSLIARVDATFINRITLFVAGTFHHMQTFNQKSSIGTQPGRSIGSVEVLGGAGIDIGKRR